MRPVGLVYDTAPAGIFAELLKVENGKIKKMCSCKNSIYLKIFFSKIDTLMQTCAPSSAMFIIPGNCNVPGKIVSPGLKKKTII